MNFPSGEKNTTITHDFSIVLAYDQLPAQKRALALMEFLNEQLCAQADFHSVQCRFEQLEDERFSREAAEVAASANMVILATMDSEQLPTAVKQWMEQWLSRRTHSEAALVATVRQDNSKQATQVHSYLENAATKAGIKFFAGVF